MTIQRWVGGCSPLPPAPAFHLFDTSGGPATVTLVGIGPYQGRVRHELRNIGPNPLTVQVANPATEKIGSATSVTINRTDGTATLVAAPDSLTWTLSFADDAAPGGTGPGSLDPRFVPADGPSVRYQQATGQSQSIASGSDVPLSLPTAVRSHPEVVRAARGAGHQFTLGPAGRWGLTAGYRLSAAGSGEFFIALRDDGNNVLTADNGQYSTVLPTMSVALTDRFPAGQVVWVDAYQSSGSAKSTDVGGNWNYFAAVWLGP